MTAIKTNLLTVSNECKVVSEADVSKLYGACDAEKQYFNTKNVQADFIANHVNFIMTSNDDNPIQTKSSDPRRFLFLSVRDTWANNEGPDNRRYFAPLRRLLNDPSSLAKYLYNRPLADFDPLDAPSKRPMATEAELSQYRRFGATV